jgi:ribose transport system substrate-binding protein
MNGFKGGPKAVAAISILLLAGIVISGCGSSSEESSASSSGDVHIGAMVSALTGYEAALIKGTEAAVKKNGGTVEAFSANYEPNKQLQQCQDAIAAGKVEGMIFYPLSGSVLVPCVREAAEAGIAIASIDTPIGPSYTSTEIQVPGITDQVIQPITNDAGAAADMVVEACEGKDLCQVAALVGNPSFEYAAERIKHLREDLAKYPSIEIVAQETGGFSEPNVAHSATQDILQSHPDVNVIVGDDDPSLAGAQKAIEEAGLMGKVALIGGGASRNGWEEVKSGNWFGSVIYLPYTSAKIATELMIKSIHGEKLKNNDLLLSEISPYHTIKLTQANAAEFKPEWSPTE